MSAGQQAVPANNANNASNEGAQKKHMSKAAVAIIAVVVVAIIVVAGVFGFRAYSDAQYNNAVAACAAASENVRNATNDYNNLVNGDASEAAALTKKDVAACSSATIRTAGSGRPTPVAVAAAGTAVLVSLLRAPTKSTTFRSPGPTPRSPH